MGKDLSTDELLQRAKATRGDPFSRGLSRGFDITQLGYGSALEGVGKLTGIASLKDYGASVVAEQEQELASKEAGATRLKDVKDAEGFADTATQALKVGQWLSTLLNFLSYPHLSPQKQGYYEQFIFA